LPFKLFCDPGNKALKKIILKNTENGTQIRLAALKAHHEKEKADLNKKLGEYEYKIRALLHSNRVKDDQLQLAEAKIKQLEQELLLSERIMENNGIICKVEDSITDDAGVSSKDVSNPVSEMTIGDLVVLNIDLASGSDDYEMKLIWSD